MFDRFQQEVLDAFLDLRSRHALPSGLENLNRASLRRHAQQVLADRYDRKDDEVIRQFFDPQNRYADHEERIARFHLDGFRPLVSFLEGKTRRPDERVVKILAWLIDFEPRPYREWLSARDTNPSHSREEIGHGTPSPGITESPPIDPPPVRSADARFTLYPILTAIIIGISIYIIMKPVGCWDKQCMYWATDRYVAICCEEQNPGVNIVAIRPYELKHFRKITRPDTLTVQHANKVWYSKIENTVEFFTAPATGHPVHHGRPIKPATAYILEKYAGK